MTMHIVITAESFIGELMKASYIPIKTTTAQHNLFCNKIRQYNALFQL